MCPNKGQVPFLRASFPVPVYQKQSASNNPDAKETYLGVANSSPPHKDPINLTGQRQINKRKTNRSLITGIWPIYIGETQEN